MSENKRKPFSILLPVIFAVTLVLGIILGMYLANKGNNQISPLTLYPKSDKINNVLRYIDQEYVDTVSMQKLSEDAIVSVLKGLDPHSVYIPAEDLQAVNEPLEGGFSGIGVQFNMTSDTVVVINTIPNGPSALVGIMAGDRIIKVDDKVVAGVKMESDAVVKRLKGPQGTNVKVAIKRPGTKRELVFDIKRDKIPLYSVDIAYMLTKNIGYLKINQFGRTTFEEFVNGIEKLNAKGMKKLVLDLRGNGGGYLEAAINIADQFLDQGKLIVYTQGRAKPREDFTATQQGICQDIKVAVLIDEFSASASEILAGAIQDNDFGTIIGRRSFGKGLVQEQTPLSDGSAIRLTVARYYTPTGRCIQKKYKNGADEDYFRDLNTRYLHGEFAHQDSIHLNDSLKFKTPKGKVVYGGGGIMPDIFVPFDTSSFSKYFDEVRDMGLIYRFAFNYSDANRNKLKRFSTVADFRKYLNQDKTYDKFIEYTRKQGLKPTPKELTTSGKTIKVQLDAYIIRNFFDNEGFYPVIHEIDNTLDKAVSVLSE